VPQVLTAQQVEHYRDQGYVMAGGVFSTAELDELEGELDALMARRLKNAADVDATWQGAWRKDLEVPTQIQHTHDLQAYSSAWARVLVHDRFTGALSDLLGPNVQLHHTKAFIKPPERGSPFPMHQDYPYFPHELGTMMAAIIHLSDADEEMGCLRVYPGTHKRGPLPVVDPAQPYCDPQEYPIAGAKACPGRRGDVFFFNYLLVHGSDINRSPRTRKTALFQVRDPADRRTDGRPDNSHALGFMMRGVNPLAAGEKLAAGSGT